MIKELRAKYKQTKLMVYTPNKQVFTLLLHQISNISKTMKTDDSWELTFNYAVIDEKEFMYEGRMYKADIDQDSCEMLIKIVGEDDFYIIKEVSPSTSAKTTLTVKCVREEESLKKLFDTPIKAIAQTPQQLFEVVKSSCKAVNLNYYFEGTDVPEDKKRSLICDDETSVWDNLQNIAKLYDGWWEIITREEGQSFNRYLFLRTQAVPSSVYYIKNKREYHGYRQSDLNFDSSEIITRMYGYGAKNEADREITIMDVNPQGNQSFIEDFSYYKEVLGMTDEQIANNVNVHQEATFRDSNITDPTELYNATLEELRKKNRPTITGSIIYNDLYVFKEETPDTHKLIDSDINELQVGQQIHVINTDIKYVFDTILKTITKNYDGNCIPTNLEISNIRSSNPFKNLIENLKTAQRITDIGTKGEPYISDTTVKDDTGETVKTKIKNAVARIETNEKSINIIVGEVSDHESRITVMEGEIVLKVTEEEMWSLIQLNPGKILMAVNSMEGETFVAIEPLKGLSVHNGKISIYNSDEELMMQGNDKGSLSVREGFKIENFDDETYVEFSKDGITFYRDGYSLRGLKINDDSDLEFMGECVFQNNLDAYNISRQGKDLDDIIDERVKQFCLDQGWEVH